MNFKSLSDAQLVNNYISGQESALSILINRHQQRLYGFIFSKVYDRDATEDIFQDTFVKVIKTLKKGKYNEQGKFLPWVMRIAHNLVIDYFRKNNRMPKFKNNDDFDITAFGKTISFSTLSKKYCENGIFNSSFTYININFMS